MKKLALILILLTCLFAGFCVACYEKPILLRALLGNARVFYPPMKAAIKVDGENRPNIRCFAMKAGFNGQPANFLVLWVPRPEKSYEREVIMIDRTGQSAGLPNDGDEDYYLLWNLFLFQSDNGSRPVLFTSGKFDKNDPRYEFRDDYIGFFEPKEVDGKEHKFEIVLNQ